MSLLLTKRTNIDCEIEDVKLIDNFNNKIIKKRPSQILMKSEKVC